VTPHPADSLRRYAAPRRRRVLIAEHGEKGLAAALARRRLAA
jgi:hypothetical protein